MLRWLLHAIRQMRIKIDKEMLMTLFDNIPKFFVLKFKQDSFCLYVFSMVSVSANPFTIMELFNPS